MTNKKKDTYTFPDGSTYVGETGEYGEYRGHGTFTSADGRVKEGIFENGKFLSARKTSPTVTAKKRPHSDNEKTIPAASGTGFAVSTSGHVVTNYHVIEGCSDVKIHHKGNVIPSTVVTHDPINDLALLNWGRFSRVVANAPSDLRQRYQNVASHDHDGFSEAVAAWLEALFIPATK